MSNVTRPHVFRSMLNVLVAPVIWVERTRGWKRTALLLVYLLVAVVGGGLIYRAASLSGLPDVGDPFDVASYSAPVTPETDDALPLYRQAEAKLQALPSMEPKYLVTEWRRAGPELRAWFASNQEALALWRKGTERARVSYRGPHDRRSEKQLTTSNGVPAFVALALLDGSRLEEQGDVAGAWDRYRAALRYSRHVTMRTGFFDRNQDLRLYSLARQRIESWASDSRVDAGLMRRALSDAMAANVMKTPDSDVFKAEYINILQSLTNPETKEQALGKIAHEALMKDGGAYAGYHQIPGFFEALWVVRNEPERSKRVLRLVFDNWLAYCDEPWALRPGLVSPLRLYDVDASAPAQTRVLPVDELARWAESTILLRQTADNLPYFQARLGNESTELAGLVIRLAEQCHLRERGAVPERPEMLVGRYLDALPDGYEPLLPRLGPRPLLPAIGVEYQYLDPDIDLLRTHQGSPAGGAATLSP